MSTEPIAMNGAGGYRGAAAPAVTAKPAWGADGPQAAAIPATVDLLARYWSRPTVEEVASWVAVRELEAETLHRISRVRRFGPICLPANVADSLGLLDEHERLFVGPGQVPCPPYESFWREDVPLDIRRSLMGPCTAELRQLYQELGLELSSPSGELPDHVAVELEALAYALSREATEQVARRLLVEHLGQWLPRLCRAVGHETSHTFYRDLAALTFDWLAAIKGYFAAVDTG